jgi:hypothetical protein
MAIALLVRSTVSVSASRHDKQTNKQTKNKSILPHVHKENASLSDMSRLHHLSDAVRNAICEQKPTAASLITRDFTVTV